MPRPRKIADDFDLMQFTNEHFNTPALHTRLSGNTKDRRRVMSWNWGMHQFDPVVIWDVLNGRKPTRGVNYHKEGSWDVTRVVRAWMTMLENHPKEPSMLQLGLLNRIRSLHRELACLHPEFYGVAVPKAKRKPAPELEALDEVDENDPLILQMTAADQ